MSSKGKITIYVDKIPNNCTECDWFFTQYEEEPDWGSGETQYCAFGASRWGCRVKRPKDCPIVPIKEGEMNENAKRI